MRPYPYGFTVWLVMKFCFAIRSGPESCDGALSSPPCAESPFAHSRCYLEWCRISCCIGEHYLSFIALTGSWARPKPSHILQLSPGQWVFAGCRRPLLDDGPSRRYHCDPCMGAWVPTPPLLSGALVRFFPLSIGLSLSVRRSAHGYVSH